jgi:hypothetical protein
MSASIAGFHACSAASMCVDPFHKGKRVVTGENGTSLWPRHPWTLDMAKPLLTGYGKSDRNGEAPCALVLAARVTPCTRDSSSFGSWHAHSVIWEDGSSAVYSFFHWFIGTLHLPR